MIDGQVGYIGGFNIGDDYLGLGKLGYWRDTHIRVEGDVIDALQIRFILDWNSQAHRHNLNMMINTSLKRQHRKSAIQIASSGPAFDLHQIEYGYTKMIMSAKNLYICKALTLFQINRISMHLKWQRMLALMYT